MGGMHHGSDNTGTEPEKAQDFALNIDATTEIGMLELSATQAIRVSIIRSRGRQYTAITPFWRKKSDDMWKPKAGVWVPVAHTGEIADCLARAAEKSRQKEA